MDAIITSSWWPVMTALTTIAGLVIGYSLLLHKTSSSQASSGGTSACGTKPQAAMLAAVPAAVPTQGLAKQHEDRPPAGGAPMPLGDEVIVQVLAADPSALTPQTASLSKGTQLSSWPLALQVALLRGRHPTTPPLVKAASTGQVGLVQYMLQSEQVDAELAAKAAVAAAAKQHIAACSALLPVGLHRLVEVYLAADKDVSKVAYNYIVVSAAAVDAQLLASVSVALCVDTCLAGRALADAAKIGQGAACQTLLHLFPDAAWPLAACVAAVDGHWELCCQLLRQGQPPVMDTLHWDAVVGMTLHRAVLTHHLEAARLVIPYFNVLPQTKEAVKGYREAFYTAITMGNVDMVRLFLDSPLSLCVARGFRMQDYVDHADYHGHREVVQLLRQRGLAWPFNLDRWLNQAIWWHALWFGLSCLWKWFNG